MTDADTGREQEHVTAADADKARRRALRAAAAAQAGYILSVRAA